MPQHSPNQTPLAAEALHFISIGVGCNCLVALRSTGILDELASGSSVDPDRLGLYGNAAALEPSLKTLEACNILGRSSGFYKLTPLGHALYQYIGLVDVFFDGYGDLLANQAAIATSTLKTPHRFVAKPAVANASTSIDQHFIVPQAIQALRTLDFQGSICDLGCGMGSMLEALSSQTGTPGLGIDINPDTVRQASSYHANNDLLTFSVGDLCNLTCVFPDVSILVQCHVFHDFIMNDQIAPILHSYSERFPKHTHFLYIDSISADPDTESIFPGFDYIHGLLGIRTPSYEDTIQAFLRQGYTIQLEQTIESLPSTYLWLFQRT